MIRLNTEKLHYIGSSEKIQQAVDRQASIREACGIGVVFHRRMRKPMAKVPAHAPEPYHLMFRDEEVLPENEAAFREIAQQVPSLPAGSKKSVP